MNRQDVCARLAEFIYIAKRAVDHQVHVQGQLGNFPDGSHDRNSDRNIGNKFAVHHVNMNIIGSRGRKRADVALEIDKVCGQNGRGYLDHRIASDTKFVETGTRPGARA